MIPFWDPGHPVLEILRRRRKSGSLPGRRDDHATLALAVEGGGMRGIVSCAMLNALEDLGYGNAFDAIYGGSSGSVNAAYFLAGKVWHSLSIYYDDLASEHFIDFRRMARREAIFNVDYAFDEVFELTKPLDYDAVLSSPIPLHVSITLVDELRTVWPSSFHSREDLKSALRAGAWLPLVTKGTATFQGQRAIDGGVLIAHPATLAIRSGCTHVLSLSTRPAGPPRAQPSLLQRYVGARLDRVRPGLGASYIQSIHDYACERAMLNNKRIDQSATPYVLDLCPPSDARSVARHETKGERLYTVARSAYEVMVLAATGEYQRAYPRLTTVDQEAQRHHMR